LDVTIEDDHTAIRLREALGTAAEFWMRLQGDHDLARAREARAA
jgi:plasmid maintenance system antidote protein VapI